jgi:glycosyltransferase 2 family protein
MRVARPVLTIAAIVFVVFAARDLAQRWEAGRVEVHWLPGLLSILPLALGLLLLAVGWKWLLERMTGRSLPTLPTVALNLESQVARYMPGKVGLVLIRMAGALSIGTTPSTVASSVLVETLSLMAVGGGCGVVALTGSFDHAFGAAAELGRWGLFLFALLALSTVILLSLDRRVIPTQLVRWLGFEGSGPLAPLRLPLSHVGYWVTWLLHGYLVTRAVGGSHEAALGSAGLYVLAPIVGFLAFAVPGGLGVREAFLSIGLTQIVGPAAAVTAALVSRTASVSMDVAGWLLARALARARAMAPDARGA